MTASIIQRTLSGALATSLVITGGMIAGYWDIPQPQITAATAPVAAPTARLLLNRQTSMSEPMPQPIDKMISGYPRAAKPPVSDGASSQTKISPPSAPPPIPMPVNSDR